MGRQRKSLGDLGFFGIIRETLNVFRGHGRTLLSIYITLLLPCAVMSFAFQQYWNHSPIFEQFLGKFFPTPVLPELQPLCIADIISKDLWLVLQAAVVQQVASGLGVQCAPVLAVALFFLLFTLLTSVVWIVPLLSTVGCMYTRERLSFVQVLAELSLLWRPWKRVLVTGIWGVLAIIAVLALNSALSQVQMLFFSSGSIWQPRVKAETLVAISVAVSTLTTSLSIIVVMYIMTILQVAYGVSALELSEDATGDYRWDSLVKSYRLLAGKRGVAVCLFILYSCCGFGLTIWSWKIEKETYVPDETGESWRPFYFQAAAVTASALLSLLNGVSTGILYVSCKTFNHEVIVVEHGTLLEEEEYVSSGISALKNEELSSSSP